MQLHQTNFLGFLLQSEPRKLALANGLRAGLALGVPMLIGQFTHRESGLFVALIAYFVNLANVGGPYRIKATAMAAATLGIAVSVLVGTLVGGVPWLAVLLTLIWGLGAGLASLYGNAGGTVGLVVGLSFIVAIAEPAGWALALPRFLLCLIAGGWAMLLSLVMWPFRPYKPLRKAVANCYEEIANCIEAFRENAIQTGTHIALDGYILEIRKALEEARTALGAERIRHQARSWMDEQLLVLIQDAERVLGSVTALIELLEINSGFAEFRAVNLLVDDALQQISAIAQATAKVISGKPTTISFDNFDRIIEALQEQRYLQRIAISVTQVDYPALVALANLVFLSEKLIKQLRYAAQIARYLQAGIHRSREVDMIPLAQENQRSLLSKLRENLTLDSPIFRHAIRLGVTLALGVTVYILAALPMGYWVTLTIMVVLKPDFGGTFQRFFYRMGGTLLGTIVAAVLAATITSKPVLEIIILLAPSKNPNKPSQKLINLSSSGAAVNPLKRNHAYLRTLEEVDFSILRRLKRFLCSVNADITSGDFLQVNTP